MHATVPAEADTDSPLTVPKPILFNLWKHHAAALRHRIRAHAEQGQAGLTTLTAELVVVGTKLMDLYVGPYAPAEIAALIVQQLSQADLVELEPFRDWIADGGGYRMLSLPDDSGWVLRLGDEADRYIHVHPGRWVPQTRRVRANVLKTAVLALATTQVHGGDPLDLSLVNRVRRDYLGLAPMGRELDGEQGIGEVIDLLNK